MEMLVTTLYVALLTVYLDGFTYLDAFVMELAQGC